MPISIALGKPLIGAVLARLSARGQARRVVDMGPGAGTYADLFRGLTPDATWCAVEVWGPYVEKYGLRDKYDQVIVADVRYLDFIKLGPSDVVLFGDMLEHMSANEARDVLARAAMKSRFMALSIPIGHWPQDEIEGNPFEVLDNCLQPYQPVRLPQLPPGIGGLFGFWGYELIKWIEPTICKVVNII